MSENIKIYSANIKIYSTNRKIYSANTLFGVMGFVKPVRQNCFPSCLLSFLCVYAAGLLCLYWPFCDVHICIYIYIYTLPFYGIGTAFPAFQCDSNDRYTLYVTERCNQYISTLLDLSFQNVRISHLTVLQCC